ncbi:hypothetical protein GOFOIKOB_5168 [Methylobacterium tardum]|jgi:uncharacterized protein (DUF1330 family)|uniref:DUF1330 domain-containing protein n=1 Tax=Methylobacterium tardum TaxID=374432 RepID=A0AA37THA1_9HYPH|nr:DUF1330 domain-containing protein [Methylobacterium tardum]URD38085.1 DUF1330 domain-containing protein [Methylobacterium tardum]GJE52100.1 hypothetical protein GOFOIKOB_5168 [Methylobacterium tardum]GLS71655.1 hypothetical protein GCM10007890_36680 [Methylobacterium tardum]
MTKGYWIARVDVRDAEAYKEYVAANGAAFAKFGGRFLVRGGAHEAVLGPARSRNVVIEFPSYADALACWNSDLYQAAKAKQRGGVEAEILVIEGYDGPQPSASEPAPDAGPASE